MHNVNREKRLRQLVSRQNQRRKLQAKQIDILCNDIIGIQKSFISTLNRFAFTADFCESIIGIDDVKKLLSVLSSTPIGIEEPGREIFDAFGSFG